LQEKDFAAGCERLAGAAAAGRPEQRFHPGQGPMLDPAGNVGA
jgi:hypothetical protein